MGGIMIQPISQDLRLNEEIHTEDQMQGLTQSKCSNVFQLLVFTSSKTKWKDLDKTPRPTKISPICCFSFSNGQRGQSWASLLALPCGCRGLSSWAILLLSQAISGKLDKKWSSQNTGSTTAVLLFHHSTTSTTTLWTKHQQNCSPFSFSHIHFLSNITFL